MRTSKLVGGIVVVAALGYMTSVTAFKTAAVTNNMQLEIVTTGSAALAMNAASAPDGGVVAAPVSGQLKITINDKMQPGSVYCFSPAFKITNNGTKTVTFAKPDITGLPTGTTLKIFKSGASPCLGANDLDSANQSLVAGGSTDIDIRVDVPEGTTLPSGPSALKIVITGTTP